MFMFLAYSCLRVDGRVSLQKISNTRYFFSLCTRPLLTEFVKQENSYLYVENDINRKSESNTDVDVCLSGNIAIAQYRLW